MLISLGGYLAEQWGGGVEILGCQDLSLATSASIPLPDIFEQFGVAQVCEASRGAVTQHHLIEPTQGVVSESDSTADLVLENGQATVGVPVARDRVSRVVGDVVDPIVPVAVNRDSMSKLGFAMGHEAIFDCQEQTRVWVENPNSVAAV